MIHLIINNSKFHSSVILTHQNHGVFSLEGSDEGVFETLGLVCLLDGLTLPRCVNLG